MDVPQARSHYEKAATNLPQKIQEGYMCMGGETCQPIQSPTLIKPERPDELNRIQEAGGPNELLLANKGESSRITSQNSGGRPNHRRNGSGQRKSRSSFSSSSGVSAHLEGESHQSSASRRTSTTSESDKINSNRSHSKHGRSNSDQKKARTRSSFSSSCSGQSSLSGSAKGHLTVPQFGVWDASDPSSGQEFTVIFNKVREEKLQEASNIQSVPPLGIDFPHGNYQSKKQSHSLFSKVFGCLGWK